MKKIKIRLFIEEQILEIGTKIKVENNNFQYLTKVMRQKINDEIAIFNGINGEFLAKITEINKKHLILEAKSKIFELKHPKNITLAFAPVKNAKIESIASKSCELGIKNFQPIITKHTIVDKINYDKFKANIKEACEQCERNDIAQIHQLKTLANFLKSEDFNEKIVIFCDESRTSKKVSQTLEKIKPEIKNKEIVILIGPEGGFAKEEFENLYKLKNIHPVNLGPQILRADTAIFCAISLVQDFLND